MKDPLTRIIRSSGAVIVSLVLLAISPRCDAQSLGTRVDAVFSEHNRSGHPGAAVVIVKDGETVFSGAYGDADIDGHVAVTTDTAFHLASVGKQMTAVGVLMLVGEGKLTLEDPIAKFLPQFRRWGAGIKIKHLLHHTSGVPDYYVDIEDTYARPSNSQALKYLSSLARLDFRPGARFDYSNAGYDTLGALIQKISGQRFGVFMQQRIFAPSGMTNTFAFDAARRRASVRAIGYGLDRGEYYVDDTSPLNGLHGSGSIYSSVVDMAKYDSALFGHKLVSVELLDKAFVSDRLNNGRKTDYGFGWDILTDDAVEKPYYGHSGEWMGFSSYYVHYPTLGLSVIVVANCSATDAETLAFDAAHAAIDNPQ